LGCREQRKEGRGRSSLPIESFIRRERFMAKILVVDDKPDMVKMLKAAL
jgi:PleD family two-component response regulator